MLHEKRRHFRLEHNVPLKISCDHGDIVTETKNLSCCGAFCSMSQRLDPMTKLKLYLLLPVSKNNRWSTKKIICEGVVVRTQAIKEEMFHTAIFFSNIASKDSRTISEFVESMIVKKDNGKHN